MVRTVFRLLAVTAAAVVQLIAGSACNLFGPDACTLIGCTGLVIEVTGAPAQTPFTPATFTIRVTTGNQTTEVSSTPTYEVSRPNGPECPPECRNARVTVPL